MRLPEQQVEDDLFAGVRALGGMSFKFAPITSGVPDRVVILPQGRIYFVELKKPGGRTRPIQTVMHDKMARRGVEVVRLSSRQEVAKWLGQF